MHTQTVQNSPLLSGNAAASRPSNAAQDDQQFAQALNHQIERQALPPAPQVQVNTAARRAEAPKPAQPQASAPAPASQQPKPSSNAAPANHANAPAKAGQDKQADNTAQSADAQGAQANTAPAEGSAAGSKSAASGQSNDDAGQTDEQKAAGEAAADMLAMLQGLAQPVAADAAAAAAAAAAAKGSRPADTAALDGDAVLDGKAGNAGVRMGADDASVDQATLLAAKAAAGEASGGKATATAQDPALADALSKLQGHAGADAAGNDKAQPRDAFQAALQQANADASQAADAAELAAKRAVQPQAGALQAAATALAPAGAANAQAAQALAGNQLHARVGSQGWDHQLGQKVVWMVNGGEQSATLTLNPPDLGPLQVVLSVSNDQANVAFTAAQPEVRAALEQALPKLRETMGDAGIMLGDASVSSGSQEQQQAFEQMASGSRGRGVANGQNGNSDEGDNAARPAPQVRRSVLSAVDTFA